MQNESNLNSEEQPSSVNVFQLIRSQKVQEVIYALDDKRHLSKQIDKDSGLSLAMFAVKELTDKHALYIIERLRKIDEGVNLQYKDKNKQTVLFIAASQGKVQCFNLLRQAGLTLEDVDSLGQTCLFMAAENNHYNIFRSLFAEEKFDYSLLNHKDKLLGHTILFYAAMKGHAQLCNYLVEKGADPFITDNCKQTAKQYAFINKHESTFNYLKNLPKMKPDQNNDSLVIQIDNVPPKAKDDIQLYRFCKIQRCISKEMKPEEIEQLFRKYREIQEVIKNPEKIPKEWLDNEDQGEDWRKVAIKVVSQCINLKCAYWFIKTPEYHEQALTKMSKIGNPMDLNTVRYKLEHYCYRQSRDFMSDMHLIWGNCEKMPNESKLILEYARELKVIFMKLLEENSFFDYI